MGSYRQLLTTPGVLGLVITSSIARLPHAMFGIGIITMLVQQSGRYWLAGAVAGTFTLANALVGPQISKLVDRHGQSRVLPAVTVFSLVMMLALIIAAYWKMPDLLLFVLAALAGTMPNMPAMVRARWTELFRGKSQLHTVFSLDTVLTELAFIIGPPLAIGLSSGIFAEAGPLTAILLLAIGVTAFLRQRQTEPKVLARNTKHTRSTLRIPALRIIVLALLAMGMIGGSIDVAVVAFANVQGWPSAASFILAAYALGSMIAGLTFGVIRVKTPIEKQFFLGVLITALTTTLPIFSPNVYVLTGMLFLAGISFAPTMVIVMNLGSMIIPQAKITEGLTWMTTGISIGVALGAMLTGLIIDTYGVQAGFGVAIAAGILMLVVVILGFRTLSSSSQVCFSD